MGQSAIHLQIFNTKLTYEQQLIELDTDHDFFIDRENLIKYGNHSYRIVDRMFLKVYWYFTSLTMYLIQLCSIVYGYSKPHT